MAKKNILSNPELKKLFHKGNVPTEENFSALIDAATHQEPEVPVGAIIAYGGKEPPAGWLLCDGQTLSDPHHVTLKRIIGSNKTPDLRSRFVVGAGKGAGKDHRPKNSESLKEYKIGEKGGEQEHLLTLREMPKHNHEYSEGDKGFNRFIKHDGEGTHHEVLDRIDTDGDEPNLMDSKPIQPKGGDQPHNNLPPYYALTYIIKY